MKLAIITSNHLRHKYFIDSLSKYFDIAGVVLEDKKRDPSKKGEGTGEEERVKSYFKDRDASEQQFFSFLDWDETIARIGADRILSIPAGEINEEVNAEVLRRWSPDYVVVFGSSILREHIIDMFPDRIINMHLGLSPYYRGSGTNFWPLYDEKPEYVGVTIHYLDKGIDTGKIIAQARPDITLGDTPHSIGNKTIQAGVVAFIDVLKKFERGENVVGNEQDHTQGKLCLFKDCEPRHIIELEEKFKDGLIEKYLDRKSKGQANI